jgi:hypothetical protein
VPINLHLEIDEFKPDLLLPQSKNPKVFEVYRRLPPGNHRYYFTVGNEIKMAKDHKLIVNNGTPDYPKRKFLILPKHKTEKEPSKWHTPKALDLAKDQTKENEDQVEYYEKDLPYLHVTDDLPRDT